MRILTIAAACMIAGPAMASYGDSSARAFLIEEAAKGQPAATGRMASLHSHRTMIRYRVRSVPGGDTLRGVVPALAAKAREIVSACGSRVVSGVRHTRVAGSGRMSLHASGRAVDLAGNPSCIYAHLRGWPGGYSTDYATAPGGAHVHFSLGGREDGLRFAHRHGRVRYAMR